MTTGTIHECDTVKVGDLVLSVAPSTRRATLEIVVERDASLVLKAPEDLSVERARQFVAAKRTWIYRKLAEKDALAGPQVVKQLVDGEGFAYLGRSHRLLLDATVDGVGLSRGRLVAPPTVRTDGGRLIRAWYAETGTRWLRRRVRPWAARLGIESVTVDVRDLGYRWGSARPSVGGQRINVHWAALQLPPTLIDYVLVHELAHLREANHTPEFWALVSRVLPDYEVRKAALASLGINVWLGDTGTPSSSAPGARQPG